CGALHEARHLPLLLQHASADDGRHRGALTPAPGLRPRQLRGYLCGRPSSRGCTDSGIPGTFDNQLVRSATISAMGTADERSSDLTPEQRERFNAFMDTIHSDPQEAERML